MVTALVEHRTTDVNTTVSGGWTALMWAAWWAGQSQRLSPWEFQPNLIFRYGHMKVVEVLLGTPEVEVDKVNQGS